MVLVLCGESMVNDKLEVNSVCVEIMCSGVVSTPVVTKRTAVLQLKSHVCVFQNCGLRRCIIAGSCYRVGVFLYYKAKETLCSAPGMAISKTLSEEETSARRQHLS